MSYKMAEEEKIDQHLFKLLGYSKLGVTLAVFNA